MKKIIPTIVLLVCALMLCALLFNFGNSSISIDGDTIDGPLGALLAVALAGGGTLIGLVLIVVFSALLAALFAGVGLVVVGALGFAALAVVAALVPVLLPLLLPLALVWYLVQRARKQRTLTRTAV